MQSRRDEERLAFRQHGYFVVPAFLAQAELEALRPECDALLARVRAESRVKGHISPSVSVLDSAAALDAADGLGQVLAFLCSARVCALLEGLAQAAEVRAPRLKKADYYHEQTKHDWDGDWHRDSQFTEYDPERERAYLSSTTSVHVRFALEDDDRLEIVPGSHRRWDTQEELGIRKGSARASAAMPDAKRVALRARDACVFHAGSIHRATYRRAPIRRTLDALYVFGPAVARRPWLSE